MTRPGQVPLYTERTPRVVAARRLTRRAGRTAAGAFLAEGPQAVREALADAARAVFSRENTHPNGGEVGCFPVKTPGASDGPADRGGRLNVARELVREVFLTDEALRRHADLAHRADELGVPVSRVTERGMAGLSETVTPQGIVAVCVLRDSPLATALAGPPRLVAVLGDVRDPGNAGTVLRSAAAAGAGSVVFAGDAVDPYNGKCVRASAGTLFHVELTRGVGIADAVDAARRAGLLVLAATGSGEASLFDLAASGLLTQPTAWVFGNEAHGLPEEVSALADHAVHVPIAARVESLNLAAAAAVCLFTSAQAQG